MSTNEQETVIVKARGQVNRMDDLISRQAAIDAEDVK